MLGAFKKIKEKFTLVRTKRREAKYAANEDMELAYATTSPEDNRLTHDQIMQPADEEEVKKKLEDVDITYTKVGGES